MREGNYILRRQQSHSSSTRPTPATRGSATIWARQQDGGHRTRIHLNIFHLEATWHIATWSSASTKMNAIILPQDPRAHHDLLPNILSHTMTYILDINLPRIEKSHLASALHAVTQGVAHQSQINSRVTLRHLELQPLPRQHHRDLIDHLRCYLGIYQALRGRILASCDPDDIYNSLTATCQYIEQLPPRRPTRVAGHQTQRETSASPSSTSSSSIDSTAIENRQPQLHIGMIYIADEEEEEEEKEEEEEEEEEEESSN